MTNLTVRPDAGPSRCPPAGPPHHDRENANAAGRGQQRKHPQLRNGAISGYGRAGGTIAGRSDRDHRDPRPRDREGSPLPGGRRPADPVNGIVTSKTAAPEGQLRRRRRCSPAPGSTWHSG